jgi:hypothetical protein
MLTRVGHLLTSLSQRCVPTNAFDAEGWSDGRVVVLDCLSLGVCYLPSGGKSSATNPLLLLPRVWACGGTQFPCRADERF